MNSREQEKLWSEELARVAGAAQTGTGIEEEKTGKRILEKISGLYGRLRSEMARVIVGQDEVIELILIAMLSKGHVLLEGVPGLGKTLMFRTLSRLMNLNFQHVQFTPDLMPSDILGTEILETDPENGQRRLRFLHGPVFCHFLLADEINRTSPKTQAALLQAMQEREVTIGNKTYPLDPPFFVLATQNPMDQEGVYPLPEAQLDRFMFNIFIDYPAYNDELEIARRYTQGDSPVLEPVLTKEDMLGLQSVVRAVLISDAVLKYAVDLVVQTRPQPAASEGSRAKQPLSFISSLVSNGAGPRASLNLILAAKARALLKGRFCATSEDIRAVAPSVLRHRIKLSFTAQAEEVRPLDVIRRLLDAVHDPRGN